MMKKLFILLSALFLFSCNTDENGVIVDPTTDGNLNGTFGADVQRNFSGIVNDLSGNPISMAQVSVGTATALTDVNGVFVIQNAAAKERFAYVKVVKTGYFNASRSLVPTAGTNMVNIAMIPNNAIATIPSGSAQTVNLPNGSTVQFTGGFKDESGNAYSGNVSVSAYHLEASNPKISEIMPGMLLGQSTSNEARALETYGMLNVELRGASGQKLQPATNQPATIKLKIDPAQLSVAPSSIPLWHFDEVKGYWVQEGTATKVGSEYVGTTSHFSWWNCDAPFPQINLTVTILNPNGQPIPNVQVGIVRAGQTYPAMGITNSSGVVSGIVPANEALTLKVYPQGCNTAIYTAAIGPFSANTVLPAITLSNATSTLSVVSGNLVNCSNNNVTNGYVIFKTGGVTSIQNMVNGTFSFPVIFCTPNITFSLEGYDAGAVQIAPEVTFTMNNNATINVGSLVACSAVTEYITYTIGASTQTIVSGISAGINTTGGISITSGISGNNMSIRLAGTTLGNYLPLVSGPTGGASNNFFEGTPGFSGALGAGGLLPANPVIFTLSNWPAVGGYIDINFSGNFNKFTGTNTPTLTAIQGTVHVVRDN